VKRTLALISIPLLLAFAIACNGNDEVTPTPSPTPAPGTPAPTPTPPATPEPTSTPEVAACLQADQYVVDGPIALDASADGNADRIDALRWAPHEGCERFVIDLVDADGNPATTPGAVEAEVLRDLGVVRIHLRDVEWIETDATDAEFEGPLAIAAYAVFAPEGGSTFVDVHLGDPAEVAVTLLDDRVVVDLVPGGGPVPAAAVTDVRVVVLEPRPGEATYPLTVTGYARTFEANVVVRIEQNGEDHYEDFTTSTGWLDGWGYYTFTIEDGPTGPITLHVGEYSARDGEWEGAAVELDMQ
jgi:hypothetical protein